MGIPFRRNFHYYRPYKSTERENKDLQEKDWILSITDDFPFYGYRKIALEMAERFGIPVALKRTYRLCRDLGIKAVHLLPPTSTPRTAHAVYPYLLKGKKITAVNQVWQTDITYCAPVLQTSSEMIIGARACMEYIYHYKEVKA